MEEDEELNDEEGLETTERTRTDKTGTMCNCWYLLTGMHFTPN